MQRFATLVRAGWATFSKDIRLRLTLVGHALNPFRPVSIGRITTPQTLTASPELGYADEAEWKQLEARHEHERILLLESQRQRAEREKLQSLLVEVGHADGLPTELAAQLSLAGQSLDLINEELRTERRVKLADELRKFVDDFVGRQFPNPEEPSEDGTYDEKCQLARLQRKHLAATKILLWTEILMQVKEDSGLRILQEPRSKAKDNQDWWEQVVVAYRKTQDVVPDLHVACNDGRLGLQVYSNLTVWLDDPNALLTPREIEVIASFCFRRQCGEWKNCVNEYTGKKDSFSCGLDGYHRELKGVHTINNSPASQWAALAKAAEQRNMTNIANNASEAEWARMIQQHTEV